MFDCEYCFLFRSHKMILKYVAIVTKELPIIMNLLKILFRTLKKTVMQQKLTLYFKLIKIIR